MRFHGLDPWPQGSDLIECDVDGTIVDLHNSADFAGVRWRPPDELDVEFVHDPARLGGVLSPADGRTRRIVITFVGVRALRLRQLPDFEAERAVDLDHWLWRPHGDLGHVTWRVGEMEIDLDAAAVRLTADPPIVDEARGDSPRRQQEPGRRSAR